MHSHARRRARRAAITVALVAGVVAGAGNAQAAPAQQSAAQLDPAFAAQPIAPGYTRKGNDFIYENGAVIISPASAAASLPCPDTYVCLYRDSNWNGTRWIFRDHYWQNLRTYGASDEVSSWSNHEDRQAVLGWDSIEQGKAPYLYLSAHAHASGMGGWNDEASSVFP
jgi:hypothetical protein